MKVTVLRDSHKMALTKPPRGVGELRMTKESIGETSRNRPCVGCLQTAFVCALFLLLGMFVSQAVFTYCGSSWIYNTDSYGSMDTMPRSSLPSSAFENFPGVNRQKSLTDSLLMAAMLKSIHREMVAEIESEGFIIVEPEPVEFIATQVETYPDGAVVQMTFGNSPLRSPSDSVNGDSEDLQKWSLLVHEALKQNSEPVRNAKTGPVEYQDDGVAADGNFNDLSQDLAKVMKMPSSSSLSSPEHEPDQKNDSDGNSPQELEASTTDLTPEAVEKYFDVPDFIGGAKPAEAGKLQL